MLRRTKASKLKIFLRGAYKVMKSWLCYLGNSTWGTTACFMFNFLCAFSFLAAVVLYLITFAARFSDFLHHAPNKSWKFSILILRLFPLTWLNRVIVTPTRDLWCWLLFAPVSPCASVIFSTSTRASNNHSWYSGVVCCLRFLLPTPKKERKIELHRCLWR